MDKRAYWCLCCGTEQLEAATRRDEEMKLIIAKLEEDKRLLQKEVRGTASWCQQ